MQCGLYGPGGDHLFHARETTPDNASAPQTHAGDHSFVQGQTGQPPGVTRQHFGRHHDIA